MANAVQTDKPKRAKRVATQVTGGITPASIPVDNPIYTRAREFASLTKTHAHGPNSIVAMSIDGGKTYERVSVWYPDPADSRFELCRVCGVAKPAFGRPRGSVNKPTVEQPSLF